MTRKRHHKLSTTARGYGPAHRQLRARWSLEVDRGSVLCGRCGRLIEPGTFWDLSHPGDDKTQQPVPWHRYENRAYASSVTKPRRNGRLVRDVGPMRRSREW